MRTIIFSIVIILFTSCNNDIRVGDIINNNYKLRYKEIKELELFFLNKLSDSIIVSIEFRNFFMIRNFSILKLNIKGEYDEVFRKRDFLRNDKLYKESLLNIGWTTKDINKLKKKLDACDCISIAGITGDNSIEIGYKRTSVGGIFQYNLFPNGMPIEFKSFITNRCNYKIIDSTAVLSYEAGVFGSDCLPKE